METRINTSPLGPFGLVNYNFSAEKKKNAGGVCKLDKWYSTGELAAGGASVLWSLDKDTCCWLKTERGGGEDSEQKGNLRGR